MKSAALPDQAAIRAIYKPILVLPQGEAAIDDLDNRLYGYALTVDIATVLGNNEKAGPDGFSGTKPFLLYFNGATPQDLSSSTDKKNFIERLILFFLSNNYIYTNNNEPVIALAETDAANIPAWKVAIDEAVVSQGIQAAVYWTIPDLPFDQQVQAKKTTLCFRVTDKANDALMEEFLFHAMEDETRMFFSASSGKELSALEAYFCSACSAYLERNRVYGPLILQNFALKHFQRLQTRQIGALTAQLQEANSFVELAKNKYKDDYDLLFTFYQNEYELLPLWYKQFGHIIKVLLGKRSFRSLFNDDVKKYKD